MAVANYFSGCEGDQHFRQAKAAQAQHILMSYMYLRKHKGDMLADRLKEFPDTKFLIDSGAHTLQVNMDKAPYNTWKLPDFESYLRKYVQWLKDNRKNFHCAVELDISYCINVCTGRDPNHEYGHKIVEEWRQKHFKPLAALGIEIIYVWHGGGSGLENWEKMCQEYGYVGLPGELSSEKDFNKFIAIARRYTTKIHGFAATKQSDFRDWPWYSIDSITWKTSEIYGTLIVWDEHNQKLRFEQDKAKRFKYKRIMRSMGFDADAIIADSNYREVTRFALRSMTAMEQFYVRKYKHRIFYYELRLPHPRRILKWKTKRLWTWWERFTPKKNFQQHTPTTDEEVRVALRSIAAVQNWDLTILTEPDCEEFKFMATYFKSYLDPLTVDPPSLKRELAMLTAPPNPPPIPRTRATDYMSSSPLVAKVREKSRLSLADLLHTPELIPMRTSDILPDSPQLD